MVTHVATNPHELHPEAKEAAPVRHCVNGPFDNNMAAYAHAIERTTVVRKVPISSLGGQVRGKTTCIENLLAAHSI